MLVLGGLILIAGASTACVWVGAGRFELSANRLSRHYDVPPIVQGAVIVAVGSSLPELLTAILAPVVHGDFELGMAAIVGSAIFNILVIPALATLAAGGSLRASRDLVYREAYFYIVAVGVFIFTLVLAVWYYPLSSGSTDGMLTPLLAFIPLSLYGLYLVLQYRAVREDTAHRTPISITPWKEWLKLGGGFFLILIGVEGLLRTAIGFGAYFETPTFLWGLTLIAAATSLPDAFVSIRAAGANRSVTSIANVFGSNTFDLLVAVPAGVLAVGGTTVAVGALSPILLVLVIATFVLFAILRTDFAIQRLEAYILLLVYLLFLAGVVLFGPGLS